MSRDDKLTINGLRRNSVHTTIDEVIGIPDTYIHRPIVGLYSNYNCNYNSGSSVLDNITNAVSRDDQERNYLDNFDHSTKRQ